VYSISTRSASVLSARTSSVQWSPQVPCINRNALTANKAVTAVRLCLLRGEEPARPTFDQVVKTMYQTGMDMSDKYKETSKGGLAVVWVDC
jgi:L-serine dehydratase